MPPENDLKRGTAELMVLASLETRSRHGYEIAKREFGIRLALGAVSVGLLLVALPACYLPARLAVRVDPMAALRTD